MQRQQQQKHLLTQATSHGPYLWSSSDVQNALLWFQSSSSSSSSDVSDTDLEVQGGECEFLRRLLHAHGINVPRPVLHSRSKKNSNKKRKSSSSRGNNNNNDGKSNIGRSNNKHKKQSKNIADDGGSISRLEDDIQQSSSSPLQSVLMGYYQLFAQSKNSAHGSDAEKQPTSLPHQTYKMHQRQLTHYSMI